MQQQLRTKNFNSFRRQLSLYGFKRLNKSFKNPMFFHPFFRQGRRELLDKIGRAKQAGMKSKLIINPKLIKSNQSLIEKANIKNEGETEQVTVLLKHLQSLDKFVGWGIVKFLKDLVPLLDKTFPEIKEKLSKDIDETQKVLYHTHFVKPFQIVNKKEILIKLINGILSEIESYLRDISMSPEEKEFEKDLLQLNDLSYSFGKTRSNQITPNKDSLFIEENTSQQMQMIIQHPFLDMDINKQTIVSPLRKGTWSKIDFDFN